MNKTVATILKAGKLSVTTGRQQILQLFLDSKGALAHADFETQLQDSLDRVTIYRTLQSFVDKGIIHTIPTNDNSIKYALCKDDCAGGHHHDHHVHFMCDQCGHTLCLDHTATPSIHLPKNFTVSHIEVVVKGICNTCNQA